MRASGVRHVAAVVAVATLGLAACTSEAPEPVPTSPTESPPATADPSASPTEEPVATFPGDTWVESPRGDWGDLDAELAASGSSCVAVVQDGQLVHEGYWNGGAPDVPVRTYSITKSLTSLLVTMGVDDGALALDDPAAETVEPWRDGPSVDVTVRDLLAQVSGREWSESIDRQLIRGVTDQTGYAVGLGQAREPGEWVYDNAGPQVLERVLAESMTTDGDVVGLAQERLLEPLGMDDTAWPRDGAGHATTYSGVTSTCRDLARVGHLMASGGQWDGDQLVSPPMVAEATAPATESNAAHGLLWWTNAEGRVVEARRQAGFDADVPAYEGRLAPNVPDDAFWAFGYGNQYIAVVPSENLVAVRLGQRPATPDQVTFDTFTAGVLRALESS